MYLEFADWLLYAQVELNMVLSLQDAAEHCTCAFCRNFYETVDAAYPNLRQFLTRFGIYIQAPAALTPITPTLYQAAYVVQGRVLREGSGPIYVDGIPITLDWGGEDGSFTLDLGIMELPWVLDEDPQTVRSPVSPDDFFAEYH